MAAAPKGAAVLSAGYLLKNELALMVSQSGYQQGLIILGRSSTIISIGLAARLLKGCIASISDVSIGEQGVILAFYFRLGTDLTEATSDRFTWVVADLRPLSAKKEG